MNVEIGTEAAQFPLEEYINGIFIAVQGLEKVLSILPHLLAYVQFPPTPQYFLFIE
jgi:hypothetical protein